MNTHVNVSWDSTRRTLGGDDVDPIVEPPAWQVVTDLRAPHACRVHAALLAAACDATVCLWLTPREVSVAEALGLRVHDTPVDATRALTEVGLALLDPRAPAWACATSHPARPGRIVVFEPADGDARAKAQILARSELDAALVVPLSGAVASSAWQVTAGRIRTARIPPHPPGDPDLRATLTRGTTLFAQEASLAELLAFQAACVLWCARWLPRFDDVHAWTREKLRRGVDLSPYLKLSTCHR